MFLTKKYISRRATLKGLGVSLALPMLDAMVPAVATAAERSVANPKARVGFFYIPHGMIMDNTPYGKEVDAWTPSGEGADFKLNKIMSPLEKYKQQVISFGNLQNAASAGSVHGLNPATWLSAVRPVQGGPGANMAITLDQAIAQKIGQETALPSLEVAAETTIQQASGGGYYSSTLSFRDEHTPLPMEYNPRKVFLQLFGEGDTDTERQLIQNQTTSMLDLISDRTKALRAELGASDQRVMDSYLDTVREIERRLDKAKARDMSKVKLPDAPVGELEKFDEQVALMYDLLRWPTRRTSRAWLRTSPSPKARTAPTTSSTCRIPSIRCRIMRTTVIASASSRCCRLGTCSSSRGSSTRWPRRRTAMVRCWTIRSSCTART